jgi:hypothetical protein
MISGWPISAFSREAKRMSSASSNSLPAARAAAQFADRDLVEVADARVQQRRTERRQHAPRSRCDIEMRHKVAGRIAAEDDDFRLAVGFEERDQTIEVRHHRVGFKVDRRIG